MSIGSLGPLTFEASTDRIRTFDQARLQLRSRWATHNVLLQPRVKEYLGPGEKKLSLSIRFDRQLGVVPDDELEQVRQMVADHDVLSLVLGGTVKGEFVLVGIGEVWTHVNADGTIAVATTTLELEEIFTT